MDAEPTSKKRPAPRGTASYQRKRAVAACQTCRSRKTKCDNQRPACSFCERAGATCIYATQDLSAYDPASLAILDRLDQLEHNIKHHISSGPSTTSPLSSMSSHVNMLTPLALEHEHHAQANIIEDSHSAPDLDLLPITVEHVLSWPVFQGRFDNHTRLIDLVKASPSLERPASVNFDLEMGVCDRLLEQCLEHVLSKNPIAQKDFLRSTMKNVCMNGPGWDAESCLVLLICALGSIASPGASQADWTMGRSYFAAAQRRIGMLIDSESLVAPQCYFLIGVYFMYNLRPLDAWRTFAQAVVCMQPDSTRALPSGHYSLEECVYWSCWKSEVELRTNFQIPSFGSIGNRYPQHMPEPPATDPSHEPKWYYYLADISLRRLDMVMRETVANILGNSVGTGSRHVELARVIPAFEEQLRDWAGSMPNVFNVHNTEEMVLHSILQGRLLDCYDVLYIPFLEATLSMASTTLDGAAVFDTYARKALDNCVQRVHENENESAATIRHHGTWLLIRTWTRSALMVLATRAAGRMDLLPERWQQPIIATTSVLNAYKNEAYDVADRLSLIRVLADEVGIALA
ncbi:hypothetical protein FB567DRAFT_63529 [Paraphoma chrysanthemicola]|uniref:Zn(2)-C6 fungal-type domain-containing protein n=1 Tax=Paraphoma chrysanthemicola TaxID=798071 RepID=A0A8K0VY97_9PLEO|nr:hypothetical protein FB567DRAFT_63529 [Paraphoma chrysanthemicola]